MFIRAVRRRTAVPDICFVGVVAASVEKGPQEATPSPEKKSCGDTVGEYAGFRAKNYSTLPVLGMNISRQPPPVLRRSLIVAQVFRMSVVCRVQ